MQSSSRRVIHRVVVESSSRRVVTRRRASSRIVEDVVVEDDGGDRAKGEGERGGTPTTVRVRRGARWMECVHASGSVDPTTV